MGFLFILLLDFWVFFLNGLIVACSVTLWLCTAVEHGEAPWKRQLKPTPQSEQSLAAGQSSRSAWQHFTLGKQPLPRGVGVAEDKK